MLSIAYAFFWHTNDRSFAVCGCQSNLRITDCGPDRSPVRTPVVTPRKHAAGQSALRVVEISAGEVRERQSQRVRESESRRVGESESRRVGESERQRARGNYAPGEQDRAVSELRDLALGPATTRTVGLVRWAWSHSVRPSLGKERTAGPRLSVVIGVHDKRCGLVVAAAVVSQRREKSPLVWAAFQCDP